MKKRKHLSNKVRFEVFKRDEFTCQYCGQSAPEVILNCDHILPVAKGGDNDILNLTTSCFECNNGKGATLLNDNSMLLMQLTQLEILQKKREQTEQLLEWRKSLENFEEEKAKILSKYINQWIIPYELPTAAHAEIKRLIKDFDLSELLDSVDTSAKTYLKYDHDGDLYEESANYFFKKIGGVAYVQRMPPLKQKLAYIRGVARKRFPDWNNKKGIEILDAYAKKLNRLKWTEEEIIREMGIHVLEMTKKSKSFSDWKAKIKQWQKDLIAWERAANNTLEEGVSIIKSEIDNLHIIVGNMNQEVEGYIAIILKLSSVFHEFETINFLTEMDEAIYNFIEKHSNILIENQSFFTRLVLTSTLPSFFIMTPKSTKAKQLIRKQVIEIMVKIFKKLHIYSLKFEQNQKDIMYTIALDKFMPGVFQPARDYRI